MPADLIVYGLVAAGLIVWLRSLLGTRHGEERQRPNPFLQPLEQDDKAPRALEDKTATPEESLALLAERSGRKFSVENKTAENALLEVMKADRQFDVYNFLNAAQDAFAIIVEVFAQGDRETLKDLLSPAVYDSFEAAIREREQRRETQMTDVHAIRKAQILAARLEGKTAFVTVRFVADETSVTRDSDGRILQGDPDRAAEIRDVWTFARDIRARDPRWMVVETRSDVEGGDNDLLPNTH